MASRLLRTVIGLLLLAAPIVLGALLAGSGLGHAIGFFADPLWGAWRLAALDPRPHGAVEAPGAPGPATIVYDGNGAPTVRAGSEDALWYAVGYVQACDRLFEMDLLRRLAEGRLAELVGEPGLKLDRFTRIIGLHLAARESLELTERLAEGGDDAAAAALRALEEYSRGVNACIERLRGERLLPLEYRLLGAEPEPWTPLDSIAVAKLIDYSLGFLLDDVYWGLLYASNGAWIAGLHLDYLQWLAHRGRYILSTVGPGDLYTPANLSFRGPVREAGWGPLDVTDSIVTPRELLRALRSQWNPYQGLELEQPRLRLGEPGEPLGASNNWALAAALTGTGRPLLANDPHLELMAPPIWYEERLEAPGLHVEGFAFPGTPFVIIGRTGSVAFGYTNSGFDTTDFYFYVWRGGRYLYRGEWLEPRVRVEEIRVRLPDGGYSVEKLRVYETVHGPLVPLDLGNTTVVLAVRSVTLQPEPIIVWAYLMDHAGSLEDVLEAQRYFYSPIQNLVAIDSSGRILYSPSGLVPVRTRLPLVMAEHPDIQELVPNTGWLPFNGSRGEGEWRGYLPYSLIPRVLSGRAWVATANNLVSLNFTPLGAGPYLQWSIHSSYRWLRIATLLRELLGENKTLTPGDMARIQCDVHSAAAEELIPRLIELAGGDAPPEAGILRGWGYEMTVDSRRAGYGYAVLLELQRLAWQRPLERAGLEWNLALASRVATLEHVEFLLKDPRGTWYLERMTSHDARWLATEALQEAAKLLRSHGFTPGETPWGKIHQVMARHALGEKLAWLNIGPEPAPGGAYTVNVAPAMEPGKPATIGPSLRIATDLDPRGGYLATLPGGESGNPWSMHYRDLFPQWLTCKPHNPAETRPVLEAELRPARR